LQSIQPSRVHELSPDELSLYRQLDTSRIPQHVAIIMDGNGRWAGKRSLKRFLGHKQGAEAVHFVVETASRINLPWLTLYAFSLENNLRRPKTEVSFLMGLLRAYLTGNVQRMNDNNVRMAYIGRIHELPSDVQETMHWAADATKHNTGTVLTLALNYGARSELVDAFRLLAAEMQAKGKSLDHVTEDDVHRHLYTAHMPDPDLVIRTSGEMRISNFLLWQIAYSEIFVTERLWPDFRGAHLLEAMVAYQQRERRYGGLNQPQPSDEIQPQESLLVPR
jgi:undecaprenyl diphosphate synthase